MDRGEDSGFFSLPDLHEFPKGTLPSPYRTLYPVRRLPEGLRLLAVGWLDGPAAYPTGPSDPAVLTRLLGLDVGFLILDGTRGYHRCFYCSSRDEEQLVLPRPTAQGSPWFRRPESSLSMGHHLVELEGSVYMCPALLPHYIRRHAYQPPQVFQDAVIRGRFLADNDLIHTGEEAHEFALQELLAAAEARGDLTAADVHRRELEAWREKLETIRPPGKPPGFVDRDTGVWRPWR